MTHRKTLPYQHAPYQHAFTMVELSIVMVIVGLIVGSVLASINIVNQSRLRADIKTLNAILTGVASFKDKYTAYPGDFSSAYTYFGTGCGANTSGATGSCNGNGSAYVDQGSTSAAPIEDLLFWSHLQFSNSYPGAFTGTISTPRSVINTNVPAASRKPGAFGAGNITSTNSYGNSNGNYVFYGAFASATQIVGDGFNAPADAYYIDAKMDDGYPATGTVLTINGTSYTTTDCVNAAATASTASYVFTSVKKACYQVIRIP